MPETQRPYIYNEPAPKTDISNKEEPTKKKTDLEMEGAHKEYADFMKSFEKTIHTYFGSTRIPFTFKKGGWYLRLDKGNPSINVDPSFFMDKGYTPSEAMFATFHELEHLRDMIKDPNAYEWLKNSVFDKKEASAQKKHEIHKAYPKILFGLYNCVEDVMVNRAVMTRWNQANNKVVEDLYKKLFPEQDLTKHPKHRQLKYAILRNAMLPNNPAIVAPEVQSAIDKWQKTLGGNTNSIDKITNINFRSENASMPAIERFQTVMATLEPIFEQFFIQDLEEKKQEEEEEEEEEEGEESDEGEEGEKKRGKNQKKKKNDKLSEKGESEESDTDPFGEDTLSESIPDPLDYEQSIKDMDELKKKLVEHAKDKQTEAFGGVTKEELAKYNKELEQIEPYVSSLVEAFKEFIQERLIPKRKLKAKNQRTGVMLNPGSAGVAYASHKAGIIDPRVMRDFKNVIKKMDHPDELEFTLVCDGSGSMDDSKKKKTQRLIAILIMEAFAKFTADLKKESEKRGQKIPFKIESEVRLFTDNDNVLKPLSGTLTHKERIGVQEALKGAGEFAAKGFFASGNNEAATFDAIRETQFTHQRIKDLKNGDLVKVVLFLSDGETDVNTIQTKMAELHRLAGADKDGKSSLLIAGIGFAEGKSVITTYQPNGYYAESLEELPEIITNFIKNCLRAI